MLLEISYNEFIAKPLKSGEENRIYIRGRVEKEDQPAYAVFRVSEIVNELIPWPQVINKATVLGTLELNYDPRRAQSKGGVTDTANSESFSARGGKLVVNRFHITNGCIVVSSSKYISYTPPDRGGRSCELIAKDVTHGYSPIPDVKNWKELLQVVGENEELSLYNVIVVDPVFDIYAHTTRLKFFDDSNSSTTINIVIEVRVHPSS